MYGQSTEGHPGKNTILGLILLVVSCVVVESVRLIVYLAVSLAVAVLSEILFTTRWRPYVAAQSDIRDTVMLRTVVISIFWPGVLLMSPLLIRRQERMRKDRIVREVMEA